MNSTEKTEKIQITTNGIGFIQLLTILFIGLKLTGNIDWAWLWILSPLWLLVLALLMGTLICVLLATIIAVIDEIAKKIQK